MPIRTIRYHLRSFIQLSHSYRVLSGPALLGNIPVVLEQQRSYTQTLFNPHVPLRPVVLHVTPEIDLIAQKMGVVYGLTASC